jgi:hypothetical protein
MYSDLVCSLAWCQSAFRSPSGPALNRAWHVMDFQLDLLSGSFYVDRLGRIALGQFNNGDKFRPRESKATLSRSRHLTGFQVPEPSARVLSLTSFL